MKSRTLTKQMTLYVDEFQENSVSFTFESAYRNFKVYYNKEHIGDVPGGINTLKSGVKIFNEDNQEVSLKLKSGEGKSYMAVSFDGIPIPSTPEYPAKQIKRSANWVMAIGIILLLFGLLIIVFNTSVLNFWQGYLFPGLGTFLIVCSIAIKKYHFWALILPLVFFLADAVAALIAPEFAGREGLYTINLGLILEVIAIIQLIRAIKPMQQMQRVKDRLKKGNREDLLDS